MSILIFYAALPFSSTDSVMSTPFPAYPTTRTALPEENERSLHSGHESTQESRPVSNGNYQLALSDVTGYLFLRDF